jgi:hypothetical protein
MSHLAASVQIRSCKSSDGARRLSRNPNLTEPQIVTVMVLQAVPAKAHF